MSDAKKYAIHEDFEKFPVMNIKFSPLVIGALNTLIKVTRVLQKRSFDLEVVEHKIKGKGGHDIKVIVMTPGNTASDVSADTAGHTASRAPVLIYYHGGGFAMTYASLHLESAERYAKETGCVCVFVSYRLAMKHPFPAGFDDAYSALEWVVEKADQLGIDPARIAVGGDSAGGALAAGVAQKCRDEKLATLCGQLLIYPVLDNRCNTVSATEFVDVPLWNAVSNRRMWDMYLQGCPTGDAPAYAAPGLGDANNLAPAYIETAEFDPLRDEALNYAQLLSASGNPPVMNETSGTIHGYDGSAKNATAVASMQKRIEFLQSAFS